MPALVLVLVAGAGAAWVFGRAVDQTGTGALKIAAAGAIGAGSALMLRRAGIL